MIREKRYDHKIQDKGVGPGGWHCTCCGPSPKNRPYYHRVSKRGAVRRFFATLIEEALAEREDQEK